MSSFTTPTPGALSANSEPAEQTPFSNLKIASAPRRFLARIIDGSLFALLSITLIAAAVAVSLQGVSEEDLNSFTSADIQTEEDALQYLIDNAAIFGILIFALISALVLISVLWATYEFISIRKNGATLGKKITKIKIISLDNSPITKRQAFLRSWLYLLTFILTGVFGLALLFILPQSLYFIIAGALSAVLPITIVFLSLVREDGRHIFDLAAKTIVVSVSEKQKKIKPIGRKILGVVYLLLTLIGSFTPDNSGGDLAITRDVVQENARASYLKAYADQLYRTAEADSAFNGQVSITDADLEKVVMQGLPDDLTWDSATNSLKLNHSGAVQEIFICPTGVQENAC
ncbi:MAG: RDD family protein [Candidatus Paceibacterota bacterium]